MCHKINSPPVATPQAEPPLRPLSEDWSDESSPSVLVVLTLSPDCSALFSSDCFAFFPSTSSAIFPWGCLAYPAFNFPALFVVPYWAAFFPSGCFNLSSAPTDSRRRSSRTLADRSPPAPVSGVGDHGSGGGGGVGVGSGWGGWGRGGRVKITDQNKCCLLDRATAAYLHLA